MNLQPIGRGLGKLITACQCSIVQAFRTGFEKKKNSREPGFIPSVLGERTGARIVIPEITMLLHCIIIKLMSEKLSYYQWKYNG